MRILVLGGTGFIGKKIAVVLQKTGDRVYSASRATGVDIRKYEDVEKCFSTIRPNAIINCAAHVGSLHHVTKYAADVIDDNIQMALNIYRAAVRICPKTRIVNPLSNCSYPGDSDVQIESEWWNGAVHESVFSYGNYKRFVFVLAKCYEKQYGIQSVNFLIPNTFGPGDSTDPDKTHALNGMIIRMIEAYRRGDAEFEIWGSGRPVREWAYVDDVISILKEGIRTNENLLYPVNVGQNKGFTIKQSAELIADAIGFTGKLVFNTKYQDGAPIKILDDTKFRQMFPLFHFFDHKKGVEETVRYYESVLT